MENRDSTVPRPTILVVDDTPDNLSLMTGILAGQYRVMVATGGEKALRIARSEHPPDLVLLDIMMPDLDGYEVCRRLKSDPLTATIPVVFVTAKADLEDERQGLEVGAVDYITKPINPHIMLARIKAQLGLKEAADFLRDKQQFLEQEVARRTREVQESYELNRQIICSAQEGIVVHDRRFRYQVWNPFMETLTGVPAACVLGRHPLEIFPFMAGTGALEQLEKVLAGEQVPGGEFPFMVPETGTSGWTFTTSAPLRDAVGDIVGVISTLRDITGHRLVEEQLRQSQKMEAVGQFASGVAHDLNNILTVIMGYGHLLDAGERLGSDQREQVGQIVAAAERAAQLASGLLTFSSKQVLNPRPEDLKSIIRHVRKFLHRVIGEDILLTEVFVDDMPLPVIVDCSQIEQVLINLATNARDAMPDGGTLTIGAGSENVQRPPEYLFDICSPGRYAWISVADSGTGMDEETCRRIFEPFFTTKEAGKGTGLGTSIIYGIIRQHKGFITVTSAQGQGTTFRIYLPLAETVAELQRERSEPTIPYGAGEVVLLAEDDPDVRSLIMSILSNFGYEVIQAADGDEAVQVFAGESARIRLILMDVIMPKKNGLDAYRSICRMKQDVKVLFVSGYTPDFMAKHGVPENEFAFVSKPVQPIALLRKIRELLDS